MPERIGFKQAKTRVRDSHCKMRQVITDKRKHDQPADYHVTRGKGCFDELPIRVGLRPRAAVFDRQLNSHVNVNNDRREQEKTDGPQQRTEIAQMLRVTIDPIWPEKNLQIAD